jgi:hypothetical protein
VTSSDLANLAQALAAAATVLSLLFVGYQIRQNTRALKATSHHAITDSFNALSALIASDQNTARIWRRGMADLANLDEDEAVSFSYFALANMRIFETLYYQYQAGTMEAQLFDAELNTLKWAFTSPGLVAWWSANPISFSAEYRAFVDDLIGKVQAEAKLVSVAASPRAAETGFAPAQAQS